MSVKDFIQAHLRTFTNVIRVLLAIREHWATPVIIVLALFALSGLTVFNFVASMYTRFVRPDVPRGDEAGRFPAWDHLHSLPRPIHGCHRGGAAAFGPENTMYNYQRCIDELHTHLLEVDLRLTKDGTIILMHDDSVDRTTNGSGFVKDFTFDEIRNLDAAYHYPELRGTGIRVPTFEECVQAVAQDQKLTFLLDIKDIRLVPDIVPLMKKYGIEKRTIVCAVDPATNEQVAAVLPPYVPLVPDIFSVMKRIMAYAFYLEWLLPWRHSFMGCVAADFTESFMTETLIRWWKREGRPVFLFGPLLDDIAFQQRFVDYGVDVLLTDRPDVLRALLDGNYNEAALKTHAFQSITRYFEGGGDD